MAKFDTLVTIGMPVYNDVNFVDKAINSLLSQSYANFELIISDDNSTDGSGQICAEFGIRDSRIYYYRQPINLGISKNMEFLVKQAKGKYFMWAANDDLWSSDFIEAHVRCLENNPGSIVAFCNYCSVDENDEIISPIVSIDFSNEILFDRLTKFVKNPNDAFGYGLFRRNKIVNICFPKWIGYNASCAYDNIFPPLCFALTCGNYSSVNEKRPLWFNRIKKAENINHKIPFGNVFLLGYFFYSIRKLNLVMESCSAIFNAKREVGIVLRIFPRLFFSWFLIPVFYNFHKKYSAYLKNGANTFI